MNRKKSNDYTSHAILVILLLLSIFGNRSPSYQTPLPRVQKFEDYAIPPFQDDGPSTDGLTTLTVTNAIPHLMVFTLQQDKQKKEARLEPCQSCKIYAYSAEIPKDICKSGTSQTIAVQPGDNYVQWSYPGAPIGAIKANWTFAPGRKYSMCPVMDLSKGRTNWDSK